MPKFIQRQIVVDAQQWFPPGEEGHDPSMLSDDKSNPTKRRQVGDLYLAFDSSLPNMMPPDIYMIRTPYGDLQVCPGDWIVTNADGDKRPFRPDEFAEKYQPLEP